MRLASAVGVETHVFATGRPSFAGLGRKLVVLDNALDSCCCRRSRTAMKVRSCGLHDCGARKQLRDGGVEPREAADPTPRDPDGAPLSSDILPQGNRLAIQDFSGASSERTSVAAAEVVGRAARTAVARGVRARRRRRRPPPPRHHHHR